MANSKLSGLTELAVTPAASDEFYVNDGGVSKKIQYSNLVPASAVWNIQSGTSYTLQESDNGKNVGFTNGSSIAVALPDALSTDFHCSLFQLGAGVPTVTPNTDTINGAGAGVAPSAQWKAMYLSQYGATTWLAVL